MNPSDEIKSKLDIVDVIREYIQLLPAGVNFRARCPFHNEKTPSFIVSHEKQIWHCFGCGKGGDIFSFVMEMEGLSFVETLRALAPKAGVVLRKTDPALNTKRNRLLDCLDLSSRYYQAVFAKSSEAVPAREYLEKRGLKEKTLEDWKIGYSSLSWDNLLNFLKKRNFTEDEIFQAGLSVRNEKGTSFYDRFRGRIMFPIFDPHGNVVAFTARVSPDREETEKMGKYINSPQTMVYDKSRILFGLDRAKQEIKKKNCVIIVEGQMDVITSHQAGFINTVASSGTAITSEQVRLLERFTDNIIFALDADSAGQDAIDKGGAAFSSRDEHLVDGEDKFGKIKKFIDPSTSYKVNIKVVEIPEGKDPDEFIKNHPDKWQALIEGAKLLMQYFFDRTLEGLDLADPGARRQAVAKLMPKIFMLGNDIDRDFWLNRLSNSVDVPERILREQLAKLKSARNANVQPKVDNQKSTPIAPLSKEERQSELFLALCLIFPRHLEYAINNVSVEQVAGQELRAIYRYLTIFYNNKGKDILMRDKTKEAASVFNNEFHEWLKVSLREESNFGGILNKNSQYSDVSAIETDYLEELSLLDKLILLGEKDFYNFEQKDAFKELVKISVYLKKASNLRRRKDIERALSEIEESGKESADARKGEIDMLYKELKIMNDEWKELENTSI
jgi:DNA primase